MAYKILTDGNGSGLIRVVGMGEYIPLKDHQSLVAECEHKSKLLTEVMNERDTLASMHIDNVRHIWESRNFGCCEEMAERHDHLLNTKRQLAHEFNMHMPNTDKLAKLASYCVNLKIGEAGQEAHEAIIKHCNLQVAVIEKLQKDSFTLQEALAWLTYITDELYSKRVVLVQLRPALDNAKNVMDYIVMQGIIPNADKVRREGQMMPIAAVKEFFWYWFITTLVLTAMFTADIPRYISYLFCFYGMLEGFAASERIRRRDE